MEMRDYITIIDGADGQPDQQGAEGQSQHPEQTNAPECGMDNLDNHSFDVPCGDEGMDGVVSADQTQPDAPDAVVIPQDGPIVKEDDFDVDPTDNIEFANNGAGSEQNQDQKGLLGEDEDPNRVAEPETYENVAEEMRDISDGIAPYLDGEDSGHDTEEKLDEEECHSLDNMEPSVDAQGHRNYSRADGKSFPERNGFTG